jgi:cardiolipin synthase C
MTPRVCGRTPLGTSRARLLLFTLAALGSGCVQLPARPELPEQFALPPGTDTTLDRMIAPVETRHPGESGFRLASDGTEAFLQRMLSVRLAARSLDIQTYIWHPDITGIYFANEVLAAADRGVRVRLLLDDLDARRNNDAIAAVAAHPRIEVRIFNPFATRHGLLAFVTEGLARFRRITRRMHNKSWIADNRFAVVGGRNVGDEYFSAGDDLNFIDLDFAMVGPVVREASAAFDRYWNHAASFPIQTLDPGSSTRPDLQRLRETLAARIAAAEDGRYTRALRSQETRAELIDGQFALQWASRYRFVVDDPSKVSRSRREIRSGPAEDALDPMVTGAREHLLIISPYFVPGRALTDSLVDLAASGKRVEVLTNSLVANDVAAVHGGYSRYRKPLLRAGVRLWELKPDGGGGPTPSSFAGSSGASLHTKAFAVDGHTLFVGSYNLDPRSTWLNSEQGVLVEDRTLTSQLEGLFAMQVTGRHAWQVQLDPDGRLRWHDDERTWRSEPRAPLSRRMQAWFARVLGLEPQL